MLRFIDLRFQGTQNRFAIFDTTSDKFETPSGEQAWKMFDEFIDGVKSDERYHRNPEEGDKYIIRVRNLCPEWVFDLPTDEELDFN